MINVTVTLRINHYIDDSENNGADILLDGRRWSKKSPGNWVGPTVILHKEKTDKALHDEIFGPVLSVLQVTDALDHNELNYRSLTVSMSR